MSHLNFQFWHFPPYFVPLKLTYLVTLFDHFWLLSTQNINIARFARNQYLKCFDSKTRFSVTIAWILDGTLGNTLAVRLCFLKRGSFTLEGDDHCTLMANPFTIVKWLPSHKSSCHFLDMLTSWLTNVTNPSFAPRIYLNLFWPQWPSRPTFCFDFDTHAPDYSSQPYYRKLCS